MKKSDQLLLAEAYSRVSQKLTPSSKTVCIEESKKKKTVSKDSHGDDNETNDYLANRKKAIENSKKKDKKGLEEAYQQILENKHINKKFAKRYNRVTSELLKADPGSKDYIKLKNERDDLVSILKDHGMTPTDLDKLLTKQEKEEIKHEAEENKEAEENNCTICDGDHNKNNCREVGGVP
jgi:hypothetical protein